MLDENILVCKEVVLKKDSSCDSSSYGYNGGISNSGSSSSEAAGSIGLPNLTEKRARETLCLDNTSDGLKVEWIVLEDISAVTRNKSSDGESTRHELFYGYKAVTSARTISSRD
ncbi:hypothetical protein M0804_002670 [Polistes exclamans]|nr:hypothetical protein M0804_002670 [Polistes exclamans]